MLTVREQSLINLVILPWKQARIALTEILELFTHESTILSLALYKESQKIVGSGLNLELLINILLSLI